MIRIRTRYEGSLRVHAEHEPSRTTLLTDAPVDNQGRGESFSPTDLVATALATCVATTIAIVAERDGIELRGMTVDVTKEMIPEPRRIGRLPVTVRVPIALDDRQRARVERAAHHCPVHRSLHADVEAPIEFVWAAAGAGEA